MSCCSLLCKKCQILNIILPFKGRPLSPRSQIVLRLPLLSYHYNVQLTRYFKSSSSSRINFNFLQSNVAASLYCVRGPFGNSGKMYLSSKIFFELQDKNIKNKNGFNFFFLKHLHCLHFVYLSVDIVTGCILLNLNVFCRNLGNTAKDEEYVEYLNMVHSDIE